MKYIVVLNGPPSCGKDTAADYLVAQNYARNGAHFSKQEFKTKLIEIACTVANITRKTWDAFYTRKGKDLPRAELANMSPRQFLIHISQKVVKPLMGDAYFGVIAATKLVDGVNVFSDSGFIAETYALIDDLPPQNILRIRIKRPGCTFEGDSRDYLPYGLFAHETTIHNNGTEDDFCTEVERNVNQWLENIKC